MNFIDSKVKISFKDNVSVDDKTIILGSSIMLNEKETLQVWLIITITKIFIYNMRIKQNNPKITSLEMYFEYFYKQEQYIARQKYFSTVSYGALKYEIHTMHNL